MSDELPVHWSHDCPKDDNWPHIHLWRKTGADDAGQVTGRVVKWDKEGGAWSSDERRERAARSFEVEPPGSLARAFGDTTARRVNRAVAGLQRRWQRIIRLNDESRAALQSQEAGE